MLLMCACSFYSSIYGKACYTSIMYYRSSDIRLWVSKSWQHLFGYHIRLENVSISFNGGKDCTVMLCLLLECYLANSQQKLKCLNIDKYSIYSSKVKSDNILKGFYISEKNQFEEVKQFIFDVEQRYSGRFDLEHIHNARNIRQGLKIYLDMHSKIQAIFVGTRQSDSRNKSLEFIQYTDPDWPQVIRVHPILYWKFQDVWKFIRNMSIPYCCLYDQGFTSIGTKDTTTRHPALGSNEPADLLPLDQNERDGRDLSRLSKDG